MNDDVHHDMEAGAPHEGVPVAPDRPGHRFSEYATLSRQEGD